MSRNDGGAGVARNVVAIVGSYRKGGTVDSAVDAILEGAKSRGAEVSKIYLLDKHIEFCTNCRSCTQMVGPERGKCVQQDDLESILSQIEAADAVVLGAPINFFNVNAMFRRFMERLVVYTYWPWDKPGAPSTRTKVTKKAALVTSAAMPGFLIRLSTGAPRALKVTARVVGAKPIATLCIGYSAVHPRQQLPGATLRKATKIGASLAT
jgi:putative NADPH-quinone reductase